MLDTDISVKRGPRFKDLAGQRFGRVLVKSLLGFLVYAGCRKAMWLCKCDCGETPTIRAEKLLCGETKSCGCLRSEMVAAKNFKHGGSNSTTFICWQAMLSRCTNENLPEWNRYGGRGIMVCEQWRNSFSQFLSDMGERPSKKHSIDRFPDNNGNYEPGNCRWATYSQQNRNRRSNRILTIDGVSMTLTEWSEKSGTPRGVLTCRLRRGWEIGRAIHEPVDKRFGVKSSHK